MKMSFYAKDDCLYLLREQVSLHVHGQLSSGLMAALVLYDLIRSAQVGWGYKNVVTCRAKPGGSLRHRSAPPQR